MIHKKGNIFYLFNRTLEKIKFRAGLDYLNDVVSTHHKYKKLLLNIGIDDIFCYRLFRFNYTNISPFQITTATTKLNSYRLYLLFLVLVEDKDYLDYTYEVFSYLVDTFTHHPDVAEYYSYVFYCDYTPDELIDIYSKCITQLDIIKE